jgi:hypothetical protein
MTTTIQTNATQSTTPPRLVSEQYLGRASGRNAALGIVGVSHAVTAHFETDHTAASVVNRLLVVEDREVDVVVQDFRGLALWRTRMIDKIRVLVQRIGSRPRLAAVTDFLKWRGEAL